MKEVSSKVAVYVSYVRPAILYESEALCLKQCEMGILQRTEGSMVRAMYGVQLKDRKRSTDLMLKLGLNEAKDQMAMEDSVRWYGDVLRREDGHILRRALDFVVEGQRKKVRPERTWQVEEETMKVVLKAEDSEVNQVCI